MLRPRVEYQRKVRSLAVIKYIDRIISLTTRVDRLIRLVVFLSFRINPCPMSHYLIPYEMGHYKDNPNSHTKSAPHTHMVQQKYELINHL